MTAYPKVIKDRVESVRFQNVPSYVFCLDKIVTVPGLGDVRFDIAFGGGSENLL